MKKMYVAYLHVHACYSYYNCYYLQQLYIQDETSLLSLGLKFTLTPKNDPITDIATHIQPAVKHLPDGIQSSIAHNVTHLLH